MDDLIWPVTWPRVTQWFGGNPAYYGRFRYGGVPLLGHNGIDLGCGVGTPVLAMDAGVVMDAGLRGGRLWELRQAQARMGRVPVCSSGAGGL